MSETVTLKAGKAKPAVQRHPWIYRGTIQHLPERAADGDVVRVVDEAGRIGPDLFQKVVFGAALDARRDVQIVEALSQAADHPVLLSFPESAYLKGLICRAI